MKKAILPIPIQIKTDTETRYQTTLPIIQRPIPITEIKYYIPIPIQTPIPISVMKEDTTTDAYTENDTNIMNKILFTNTSYTRYRFYK